MAIICTPSELAELSKCFTCLTAAQRSAAQTYALAVMAGVSLDPAVLMEEAKCFFCLTPKQLKMVQPYLMCLIAGGVAPPSPGECENVEGEGEPI